MATEDIVYDVVIVGGGIMGALAAEALTQAGRRVLILEAGRASGLRFDDYQSYVQHYLAANPKVTNSPFPQNPMAPSAYENDITTITPAAPDLVGYQVQRGPLPFGSTYLRTLGGTSMHWLGTCPRMLPNDFRLASVYGVGLDWPIGYDDLAPYYCRAEWAMGVAGNKEDQTYFGVHFPEDYDYPMQRIPPSYSDQQLAAHVAGTTVRFGGHDYPVWVESLPQARNSIPRGDYQPVGAVGAPHLGQRCEGNASCIPICPAQAKYHSVKTLARLDPALADLQTQCVATKVLVGEDRRISGIQVCRYLDESGLNVQTFVARGHLYVLAAHAVENAKLLLQSDAANSSDQVGRNLMDHPFFITWAMAPMNLGMFRGPGQTSGIPSFRDGPFRRDFAAMRIDLGNWGWDVATFPPNSDVIAGVAQGLYGRRLREQLADELPRQLRIGYVIEQLPEPGNRVTISPEFPGPLGTARPVLEYNLSDYTRKAMLAGTKISKHVFTAMGIGPDQIMSHYPPDSASYFTVRDDDGRTVGLNFMGSGHHMGTHRMGTSRTNSVVDRHSRSWDHDNLYVVGCGSMVTSGSGNPTLTGAALTLMATDHMLHRLSSGGRP